MLLVLSLVPILKQQQFNELINRTSRRINIENRNYYFCDDMINMKNFHSNLLTIDKKSHNEIDIYNIGYIKIKKFSDCENTHIVNPLCLIINSATGHLKKKRRKIFNS